MSWIGGLNDSFNQLSSLTGELGGRLSNFTREVLTEDGDIGEENVKAAGDELSIDKLHEQLKQNEALISNLKQDNIYLQEKVHKAELLISTSGIEYEARLQQKTKEIAQLKHKLAAHDDHGNSGFGEPVLSSSFSSVSLKDDVDEDFHDIINYQREINRLSQELDEANTNVEKWKLKANSAKSATLTESAGQNTDLVLTKKIRELEEALRRESDHHQQEIQSFQDAHNAKISKYQDENRKLKRNASESPVQDGSGPTTPSDNAILQSKRQIETELDSLKEKMRIRNRQLQMQKKQIEEISISLNAAEKELENVKERKDAVLKEKEIEKKHMLSKIDAKDEDLHDIKECLSNFLSVAGLSIEVHHENIVKSLTEVNDHYLHLVEEKLQIQNDNAQKETEIEQLSIKIADFERVERDDAQTVQQESEVEENDFDAELAESDQWHEDGIHQVAEEDQNSEQTDAESDQYQRRYLQPHINFGLPLNHSSPQVHNARRRLREDSQPGTPIQNPGDLTLTLQALQKQVEDYELEIEQYEQVQSEWHVEKKSLQELLNRYQNEVAEPEAEGQPQTCEPDNERAMMVEKLRQELKDLSEARGDLEKETNRLQQEKEQLQVATRNLEEELNASICETQSEKGQADALKIQLEKNESEKEKLKAAYDVLTQELNESREEKDDLDQALDALDSQHQDEMAQLLVVRDNLKEQLKSTQNQLKMESDAKDELSRKLDDMSHISQQSNDDEQKMLSEKLSVAENKLLEFKEIVKIEKENYFTQCETLKSTLDDVIKEKQLMTEKLSKFENNLSERTLEVSDLTVLLENARLEAFKMQEDVNKNFQNSLKKLNQQHLDEMSRKEVDIIRIVKEKDDLVAELNVKLKDKESVKTKKESLQNYDDDGIDSEKKSLNHLLKEAKQQIKFIENEKEESERKFLSEVSRHQEEIEILGAELENAGKEMAEMQSNHDEERRKILRENQDNVHKLEEESHRKVEELERNQESYVIERIATDKVYLEKISHLEKLNCSLQKEVEDIQAEDVDSASKVSQENLAIIGNLQQKYKNLSEQYNLLMNELSGLKILMETERLALESRIKSEIDEKMISQKECSELKNLLRKATDAETFLGEELSTIKLELEYSERKIITLSEKLTQKEESYITEKDNYTTENSNSLQNMKDEYEAKIGSLSNEIENLKKNDKNESPRNIEDILNDIQSQDIVSLEKSDLSKDDIGSLLKLIQERDQVIEVLTQRQASPPTFDTTKSITEIRRLEDTNQSLTAEKDQILAVISEKTRENKKLKDEAHKMMGIVAENNAALGKVQQENAALLAKYEGYDKEMTKEAVGKLSRLVQEKELEIESLKQKCGTLLEVLQQQTGGDVPTENAMSGQQVQNLIQDKETLMGQVQQLLNERNHLVMLLNQRQNEVEEARSEVAKASEALERDSDNNSKLQIGYSNLVHDYEQTQLKLTSVLRELAPLKEKMSQLENLKETLLKNLDIEDNCAPVRQSESLQTSEERKKVSAVLQNTSKQINGDSGEILLLREQLTQKDSMVRQADNESTIKGKEIGKLINDSKEKDLLIHSRTEEMTKAKKELAAKTNEVEILRKSVENLRDQISSRSKDCDELRSEVRNYSSRFTEKDAESQAFQETNAQLSMLLKEKEYELENAKDKCRRFESMAKENQEGQETEAQSLLVELDNTKQTLIAARQERDQVMLSLKQRKLEADKYCEEARNLREKETKLESELARLRNHLIQVEEAYTQEAVLAEDRETSLKEELQKIQSTNMVAREANEHSVQQAESLQEQLRTAILQRNQAVQQLQFSQEQGMQYATALQKLQVAVERMQREDAANFAETLEKVSQQLQQRNIDANIYEKTAADLKTKLDNSNEALKSASRLNQQLELKEENIAHLKNIVSEKQLQMDDLQDKLHHVNAKSEGMVDKEIMKNLVIGYFTSPGNKRPDVLRLITAVLGFSTEETHRLQTSGQQGGARGWIGGWLWRGGSGPQGRPSASVPTSPRGSGTNESFSQMFVKFLENESVPHQAARLPAALMISEAQQKMNQRRTPRSPGLSSVPTPVGSMMAERTEPTVAGRYSPFLFSASAPNTPLRNNITSNMTASQGLSLHPITPILPTFAPIINPKPAAEKDILQDILLGNSDR